MSREVHILEATVANGQQTSGAFDVHESISGAIKIPATFAGATAYFQASTGRAYVTDAKMADVYNTTGARCEASLVTSTWLQVPAEVMQHSAIRMISYKAQTAAQTLTMVAKD